MSKSMYVNVVNEEETRIAVVSDGKLDALTIATAQGESIEGNIYKAKVDKVLPGLDAAFVSYGRERNGFLALSEIRPEYFTNGERRPENLKRNQELLVQVKKGEIGEKGAALTTYASIPGRYLVIMPFVGKQGVSRQIQDESVRRTLREVLDEGALPEGMGYIVRTAAGDQKKADLQRDLNFLLRIWKRILAQYEKAKAPALLYRESDMVIRTLRDYFNAEIDELLVDDQRVFERVSEFFRAVMPASAKKLHFYEGRSPLFSKHNLEAQIESIHEEKVKLPSGGSIVIQQTEALVSVDVNSGAGAKNKDIEQTALATNLEAAHEVARQLKLRDLGGLIVVDFIDMRSTGHRNEVRKELQKALKTDKARSDVGTISKFGLLELSRQRLRGASAPRLSSTCPLCGGAGTLRSTPSFSLTVLRVLQAVLAKGKRVRIVRAGVDAETAAHLLNRKRASLLDLEKLFGVTIELYAEPDLPPNRYRLEFLGADKPRVETNLPSDFPIERLLCVKTPPAAEVDPLAGGISYETLAEPGDDEIPDEPPEGVEAPPATPAEPTETADEGGKKRKRRRRRKKRGGGQGASPDAAMTVADADTPVAEAEEESDAGDETEGGEAPSPEGGSSRKRRRSRRRRRGKGRQGGQAAASTEATPAAEPVAAQPPPEPPAPPAAEPVEKAPKPARKPRKKAPSKAKAAETAAVPAPEPAAEASEEKKPSPRRRAPRRPKKAPEE